MVTFMPYSARPVSLMAAALVAAMMMATQLSSCGAQQHRRLLDNGVVSENEVAPYDFNKCLPEMIMLCEGTYTQKCLACASRNSVALQRAGCTNDDVETICNTAAMAVVNITVEPPVFQQVQHGGYPAPIMGLTVTRIANFSGSPPPADAQARQLTHGHGL